MVGVGRPRWFVSLGLVAPRRPPRPRPAGEQLQIRAGAAGFDDVVGFVRLARVLALAGGDDVDLPATGLSRAGIFAAHAEEEEFSNIAKVKADSAPVWPAIFACFVPHDIGFVAETPSLHNGYPLRKKGVWDPEIKMAC